MRDPEPHELPAPPHSMEAEQSVLGALLIDNAAAARIEGLLEAPDFYSAVHREIFEALLAMMAAGPADVVTLTEYLRSRGRLEAIGGFTYLGALVENVPTAENIKAYAEIVRELALRRRLAAVGREITDAALAPASDTAPTLLDDAREKVDELAISGPAARGSLATYTAAQLAQRPTINRDWVVDRWMPARANAVFGGHGGVGKSMVMAMAAVCIGAGVPFYGLATTQGPVIIYSCEDDVDEYLYRMRCAAEYTQVGFEGLPITLIDALDSAADPALFAPPTDDARAQAKLTPAGARLSKMVRELRPALVILDAATDTFGGDEIRRREVRRYLRAMQHALATWGPCVLHVLHVDKSAARSGTTTDLYSGSTDWNNGVRARLAFYRPHAPGGGEEDDDGIDEAPLRLELQKSNYSRRGAFIDLRYDAEAHVFVRVAGSDATAVGDLVSSISKRSDERSLLRAIAAAEDAGDPVHSSERANRNAAVRLAVRQDLPDRFRGRRGKKALFGCLLRLKHDGLLVEHEVKSGARHRTTVWLLTPSGREEAA